MGMTAPINFSEVVGLPKEVVELIIVTRQECFTILNGD